MSFISGSNSRTPAIAGALDFKAVIVERALLGEAVGYDIEVCSEYDKILVGVFALGQRVGDLWCCSCRIAVRLTVLSKEDISDILTGQYRPTGSGEFGKIIGVHMRLKRQEEMIAFGELFSTTPLSETGQPRHSEWVRKHSSSLLSTSILFFSFCIFRTSSF